MDVTPMRLAGELVTSDATIEVRSPYDGRLVGLVPSATTDDLDRAVAHALALHEAGGFHAHARAAVLDRAAMAVADDLERLARIVSDEVGKPIVQARGEVTRGIETIRFSAAVARTMTGETIPLDATPGGEGRLGLVRRIPIGVVAAISPFNFPFNLVCHKVMPAIAAGCPVVLKPASATPLSALALAELLVERCGLPEGWLQVVTCRGSVADHLVTHPDVALVTFTGSPSVGWSIRERAPRTRVSLELGNNSPVIIEPDADLGAVVAGLRTAGFTNSGQSCISTQRVYVHESVADELVTRLVEEVSSIVVGDPADERTEVSALIDAGETERVESWIADAVAAGATVACGGRRRDDGVLEPTVLVDVTDDMKVCSHEVFGPVLAVARYSTLDEAIERANDTDYGLQAGIFTASIDTALRAADELDYGGVMVNEMPTWRADQQPYGGLRDSGNTREGPAYAAREMTEERVVVFQPTRR